MDRIHKIRSTKGKATRRIHTVRGETYEKNKQHLVLMMYGQICGNLCPMQRKKKAKQRWVVEKPKLENARQSRGIFFIEPNNEEFKLTVKAARRKLEVPMPATMPCKIPIKSSGDTHRNIGKCKTKYACVVDADKIHETKARRSWTQTSSRSCYCKWDEFYDSS